jgi:hypothetical protein
MLLLPDIGYDVTYLLWRNTGNLRHIAEVPVMTPHTETYCTVETEISMMVGLIDFMDQRRSMLCTLSFIAMAALAIGGEQ